MASADTEKVRAIAKAYKEKHPKIKGRTPSSALVKARAIAYKTKSRGPKSGAKLVKPPVHTAPQQRAVKGRSANEVAEIDYLLSLGKSRAGAEHDISLRKKPRDIRTEEARKKAKDIVWAKGVIGPVSGTRSPGVKKVYRQAGQIKKKPVVDTRVGFNSVSPKSSSSKLTYNNTPTRPASAAEYDASYPVPKTASMVTKRAKAAKVVKYAPLKMKVTAREVPRETWAQRSAKYQQNLAKQRMIKASRK